VIDERKGLIATRSQAAAVEAFRTWLGTTLEGQAVTNEARRKLVGLNLACWCKPGTPCHADVLLQIANEAHNAEVTGGPLAARPVD